MSHEWLDIQSFFEDQRVLKAITDLSLALKYELAGIEDEERAVRAAEARTVLRQFLASLGRLTARSREERVLSLSHRSKELLDAYRAARGDTANFHSAVMRMGAEAGLGQLDATDARGKRELLASLDELRRIISRHQHTTLSAIVEEY